MMGWIDDIADDLGAETAGLLRDEGADDEVANVVGNVVGALASTAGSEAANALGVGASEEDGELYQAIKNATFYTESNPNIWGMDYGPGTMYWEVVPNQPPPKAKGGISVPTVVVKTPAAAALQPYYAVFWPLYAALRMVKTAVEGFGDRLPRQQVLIGTIAWTEIAEMIQGLAGDLPVSQLDALAVEARKGGYDGSGGSYGGVNVAGQNWMPSTMVAVGADEIEGAKDFASYYDTLLAAGVVEKLIGPDGQPIDTITKAVKWTMGDSGAGILAAFLKGSEKVARHLASTGQLADWDDYLSYSPGAVVSREQKNEAMRRAGIDPVINRGNLDLKRVGQAARMLKNGRRYAGPVSQALKPQPAIPPAALAIPAAALLFLLA